jgi:PAS domain S-box-containing protein
MYPAYAWEPNNLADTGAEAHLSEQSFRTLADFIPHIVWTTRPNGVLDYCNRCFYEYTGLQPNGATLQSDWSSSIHPEDLEPAHQLWKECIRTGQPYEAQIRMRQNGVGAYRRHLARAVPLRDDPQDHITKWFGTCIDIEDIKQTEERVAFMFEREHRIAATLQRALLPTQLPVVPNITLNWEYRPATQESQVGGDWYDAFLLPDKSLFISIGDVCGHGLDAAIAMNTIRQSLRTLAFECPEPWLVLEGINRILQCEQSETIATAIFGRLDLRTLEFAYAGAGHPPPVLMNEAGAPRMLPAGGMPLGIFSIGAEIARHTINLEPGTSVFLYTDGLIEFNRDVLRNEERLLRVIAELSPLDTTPANTIVSTMLGRITQTDDIAVLVLQTDEHPLEKIDVSLPSVPASASGVRRLTRRFIRAHGLSENERFRILTACGEAVANATEYAYNESPSSLHVIIERNKNAIEATVRDNGSDRAILHSDRERGKGMLIMHALSDDVQIQQEKNGKSVRLHFHICTEYSYKDNHT